MDEVLSKPFLDPETSNPRLKIFGDLAKGAGEVVQRIPILTMWSKDNQLPQKLEKLGLAASRAFIPEFIGGAAMFRSSKNRYAGPGLTLAIEGSLVLPGGTLFGPVGAAEGYLLGRAAILAIEHFGDKYLEAKRKK